MAEIRGRHPHVALAEVDAEHRPGGAAEEQEPRRTPATGRGTAAAVAFEKYALPLELGHDACHGGARETGAPRQLRTARRSGLA